PTPGPREDSDDRAGAEEWCAIPVPMRPAAPDPGTETAWGTPAKTPLYPQRLGAGATAPAPAREQRVHGRKPPATRQPAAPHPGKETAWGTPAKPPLYPQRLGACANVTAPAREQRVYCRKPPATRQPATRQLAASGTTLAADTAAACPGRSITDISPAGAG